MPVLPKDIPFNREPCPVRGDRGHDIYLKLVDNGTRFEWYCKKCGAGTNRKTKWTTPTSKEP